MDRLVFLRRAWVRAYPSRQLPRIRCQVLRTLKGTFSPIHHAATGSYSWIRPPRTSIRRTPGNSVEIGHSGAPAGV